MEDLRGKTTIEILQRIKNMMEEKGTTPAQFQDRIIFMSMYNDVEYWKQNNRTSVGTMQCNSPCMHEISNQDIDHVLDLERGKIGMEA